MRGAAIAASVLGADDARVVVVVTGVDGLARLDGFAAASADRETRSGEGLDLAACVAEANVVVLAIPHPFACLLPGGHQPAPSRSAGDDPPELFSATVIRSDPRRPAIAGGDTAKSAGVHLRSRLKTGSTMRVCGDPMGCLIDTLVASVETRREVPGPPLITTAPPLAVRASTPRKDRVPRPAADGTRHRLTKPW